MAITSATFISDIVIFIRNLLRTNITDPLGDRSSGFVNTAFPKRDTKYPLLTIRNIGIDTLKLGMQSEQRWTTLSLEVRIYARNAKESDELTQEAINILQKNQFGTGSTDEEEIHDFEITSVVPIVDVEGDLTVHSQVISVEYKVII